MNIFSNLRIYAGKWSVKSSRYFTSEEISQVSQAVIVPSDYGNSVQFTMISGGFTYIPLSQDAIAAVGEAIDLTKARLLTLEKPGEADIFRVEI